MTRLMQGSLKVYDRLLVLYPDDLRGDFGEEMIEAFADDLAREYAAHGPRGVVRVWRITLRELAGIALPSLLRIPAIAVPGLSAAAVLISQSPLLVVALRYPGRIWLTDTLLTLAIEAAVTALTAFAAIYRWRNARPISLGI